MCARGRPPSDLHKPPVTELTTCSMTVCSFASPQDYEHLESCSCCTQHRGGLSSNGQHAFPLDMAPERS